MSGKARWMLASEAKAMNLEVQDSIKPESETLQERFERQLRLNSAAASALLPSGNVDSATIDTVEEVAHEDVSHPEPQEEAEEEEDTAAIEAEIEVLENKTQASLRGRAEWRTVELQVCNHLFGLKLNHLIGQHVLVLNSGRFDLHSS
jgi:hypothetical protein